MKLENQVVSLELAKKLKELGVKQESLYYWNYIVSSSYEGNDDHATRREGWKLEMAHWEDEKAQWCSAFTVAELGEILSKVSGEVFRTAYGEVFNVRGTAVVTPHGVQQLLTNPNLCAKMLIYLLENSLITL